MSKILVNAVKEIAKLLKEDVCKNVSFHPQSDFVEISSSREYKFPAILMRGPSIKEDLIFRSEGGSVVKDLITGAYTKTPMPVVSDVYFSILLLTEGDIEGLEAISNIISFFAKTTQIEVAESDTAPKKIYNVVLMDPITESTTANISDITRYEGKFCIEGIEFSSGDNTIGKIAIEVNPNVNQY